MASIVLEVADMALLADLAGSRVEIPHLLVADPDESWDSAMVWFDDAAYGQLPVEYRGQGMQAQVVCRARFTHAEHDQLVAFLGLLRAARVASDARLVLRTHSGNVGGLDGPFVGVVPTIPRSRVMGQAHDVPFTLIRTASTVEV